MSNAESSVQIPDVTPEQVWALVSDVTRTGEWSPENVGGRWLGRAAEPAVGARFAAWNRRGWRRWRTRCTVVAADPGRRFAFDVSGLGLPVSRWDYCVAPDGDGSTVTLTWTDRRTGPIGWLVVASGRVLSGAVIDRSHVARNIEESLARLRSRLVESR